MVSPISSSKRRYCPALDETIAASRCVANRITQIQCPLSCPFNPFNPNAPKAFDAVVGRGLAALARWLEKTVGQSEWRRRFDAMDRRFMPERDLALISYEAQWSLLFLALHEDVFPELRSVLSNPDSGGLRNDVRIVLDKLAQSQALLVEVTEANEALPYYAVRDVFGAQSEYLYVDFGDQEPLQRGALMFGRFLTHENCLYVIPGVFVGTPEVKEQVVAEIIDFLQADPEMIAEEMQGALPEIWNLCAAAQDEADGVDDLHEDENESAMIEEPYKAELVMLDSKIDTVIALREHPIFEEIDPPEFGVDPLGESVFGAYVSPELARPSEDFEEDEEFDAFEEDSAVKVGTVYVGPDSLQVTALNPVELELLKALVAQIVRCG